MTEIEQRLRSVLTAQAARVETELSGARLRELADGRARTTRRAAVQALAAAAAVAVIAIAPQALKTPAHHPSTPSRLPAGQSPAAPTESHAPTNSPTRAPTRPPVPSPLRTRSSAPAVRVPSPSATAAPPAAPSRRATGSRTLSISKSSAPGGLAVAPTEPRRSATDGRSGA